MEFGAAVKENTGIFPSFTAIVKNIFITYGFMLVSLFLFALIITYTDFPENWVSAVVLLLTIISIMLSGLLTAREGGAMGWLCGATSGLLYMITLYCISSLVFGNIGFGLNALTMLAIGLFSGTFGGILGINMKSAGRR